MQWTFSYVGCNSVEGKGVARRNCCKQAFLHSLRIDYVNAGLQRRRLPAPTQPSITINIDLLLTAPQRRAPGSRFGLLRRNVAHPANGGNRHKRKMPKCLPTRDVL